jgi:hypothetical protein
MLTHEKMVRKMLSNPRVKASYDSMEDEFSFLDECLKARKHAKITQAGARASTLPPSIHCANMPKHADANLKSSSSRHEKKHYAQNPALRANCKKA